MDPISFNLVPLDIFFILDALLAKDFILLELKIKYLSELWYVAI